ncbi:collagen alpha-2(I) chain-like isoform X3 [Prinia subflava]|uniref:collagen alpha-2(I) chain-like isoform X3 n=1 Tax=Prinia subflava TaxID=208062 RepID=UPI002FE418B5
MPPGARLWRYPVGSLQQPRCPATHPNLGGPLPLPPFPLRSPQSPRGTGHSSSFRSVPLEPCGGAGGRAVRAPSRERGSPGAAPHLLRARPRGSRCPGEGGRPGKVGAQGKAGAQGKWAPRALGAARSSASAAPPPRAVPLPLSFPTCPSRQQACREPDSFTFILRVKDGKKSKTGNFPGCHQGFKRHRAAPLRQSRRDGGTEGSETAEQADRISRSSVKTLPVKRGNISVKVLLKYRSGRRRLKHTQGK